jgi:hypothetical protein
LSGPIKVITDIYIHTSNPFKPTSLYLRADTVGGKLVAKELLIEVCGLETLVVKSSDTFKKLGLAPGTGLFEVISTTVSSGWFTFTNYYYDSDCVVTSYELFSDSDAVTPWSNSEVFQDTLAVNMNYDIKIAKGSGLGI